MSLTETNIKIISIIVSIVLTMASILMIIYDIDILLREPTDIFKKMSVRNLNTAAVLNIIPNVFNIIVTLHFVCYKTIDQKSAGLSESVKWLSVLSSWTVFFAIFSYFFLSDTQEMTKKNLIHLCNEYNTSTTSRSEVDYLQYELNCCGVDDPNYWITQNFYNYVQSCYDNNKLLGNKSEPWPTGCVKKITEMNSMYIKRKSIEIFLFIMTFEIVIIGIMLYLAVKLKEIERRILKRQQLEIPLH